MGRDGATVTAAVYWIPEGDQGTEATVERMAGLARHGQVEPTATHQAQVIIAGCRPRDSGCYLYTLRRWLASHFLFVYDSRDVENLRTPEYLLTHLDPIGRAMGDCDDAAVLAAGLCLILGIERVRFVVLRYGCIDGAFRHVYTEAQTEAGNWVSFDVTRPNEPVAAASESWAYDV